MGPPSLPWFWRGWAAAELGDPSNSAKSQRRLSQHLCQRNRIETMCHILVTGSAQDLVDSLG